MLYQLCEVQRAILKPVSSWADSMSSLYGDPYSPFSMTPYSSRIAAGFELLYRLGKDYEKPEFGLSSTTVEGTEVPVVERAPDQRRELPHVADRLLDEVVRAQA